MKLGRVGSSLALLCALAGCSKVKSLLGKDEPAPAASASAPAATLPPTDRAPKPGEVCTQLERKVWGKWANRRTGITASKVEGRLAVGFALGNAPHVVVFDGAGSGRLLRPKPPAGSALDADLRAPDRRDLQRVTPAQGADGRVTAYADFRDKHRDGRRRIACGPVESNRPLLVFDGKPLLEREEDEPAPKPEARRTETPDAGRRRLDPKVIGGLLRARGAALPDAGAPRRPERRLESKKTLREVRDCRTFVDPDGAVWAVGSELVGKEQGEGDVKWSMRFFAAPDSGRGYVTLHSVALPKQPKTLHTFESPVAGPVGDGHVVFARYQGSLMGWALGAGFRPRGSLRVYRGGYPTMPHFFGDLMVTSLKIADDRYALRWAPLDESLPKALSRLELDAVAASLAEPTLARSGDQRWLSFQAGERREGRLTLVPVDARFQAVGRPHAVTPEGVTVYESHVFGLGGGKLLAVYLQNGDPGAELVSEVLSCQVEN